MSGAQTAVASVELSEAEGQAVAELATAYATAVPPERAAPYTALARAALGGSVEGDDLAALERVTVLALETGKAHRLGLAETEQLIAGVYARTPVGRARAAEAAEVNRVLERLAGRELTKAKVSARRPGRYTVDLGVAGFDLTLVLDPSGIEVQRLTTS